MLNFANPNFLGSKNDFRKNFELAIIRGRDADATDNVKAECEKKLKELGGIVSKFIIRRTNDLLSKYRKPPLIFAGCMLSLMAIVISARQVRASGVLSTFRVAASTLPALHLVARMSVIAPRHELPAAQGDQHPKEAMQPPRAP